MVQARVPETDSGIQEGFTVVHYDSMQRRLRDRGWMETDALLRSGIVSGQVLEIEPGPGYLGLEWLSRTEDTRLTAVEISAEMIAVARKNAQAYGLEQRVEYVPGDAHHLPFWDATFDGVFSNGSLHEWSRPAVVFSEILRVLKLGARLFVSDLRRDMPRPVAWFLRLATRPAEIRPGLLSSIRAVYTPEEARTLVEELPLAELSVTGNAVGLQISGIRRA